MKSLTTLALILGATLPVTAQAGGLDLAVVEPVIVQPTAPVYVAPNGDWTGAYAGASLGFGTFSVTGQPDGNEGIVGLNLGYRKDFGKIVLGGELSYSKNDIGAKAGDNQINTSTAAKLMLGADMGRTLVYVSGGAAQAEAQLAGGTATDMGYFGGLGVDYALSDGWTIGGEVIASQYNDFDNSGIDIRDTTLSLKVGYRF
jgi:outer membrane immunogenic protein